MEIIIDLSLASPKGEEVVSLVEIIIDLSLASPKGEEVVSFVVQ